MQNSTESSIHARHTCSLLHKYAHLITYRSTWTYTKHQNMQSSTESSIQARHTCSLLHKYAHLITYRSTWTHTKHQNMQSSTESSIHVTPPPPPPPHTHSLPLSHKHTFDNIYAYRIYRAIWIHTDQSTAWLTRQ